MRHIILEAGWPIGPILILGIVSLSLAISHAMTPHRARVPLLVATGVATVLLGIFGTALGAQLSLGFAAHHEGEAWRLAFVGIKESLWNLEAALVFAVGTAIAGGIGSFRLKC